MRTPVRLLNPLVAVMLFSGCGGGSSGPDIFTCTAQPCGGNPVGVWDLYTYCTTDPSVIGYAETATFNSDGTFCTSGCGTWSVSGNKISLTFNGHSTTTDYCISGNSFLWGGGANAVVRHRHGVTIPAPTR